ncbi:MAG: hypothetical protein AB7S26_26250 [Sandaracinaceae bacterium]
MKRRLLIALFALGTVAGFGSGISSMACWHHRAEQRRAAFEQHVADVCVEAAQRARPAYGPAAYGPYDRPPPPPQRGHRGHADRRGHDDG